MLSQQKEKAVHSHSQYRLITRRDAMLRVSAYSRDATYCVSTPVNIDI